MIFTVFANHYFFLKKVPEKGEENGGCKALFYLQKCEAEGGRIVEVEGG